MNLTLAKVVIVVDGGIAYVRKAPKGLRVMVVDCDTGSSEPYYVKEAHVEATKACPKGELVLTQVIKVKGRGKTALKVEKFLEGLEGGV